MRQSRALVLALAVIAAAAAGLECPPLPGAEPDTEIELPGLLGEVQVVTDAKGTPHITATNDLDAARVQGFLHARDRFFQMDLTRREVDGTLAELLGEGALGGDIQNRTIGLRRAAVRSFDSLPAREREVLEAYAEGVNAWLAANPLPAQYAELELTTAREWDPIDTLGIGKGIAASLSLDIDAGLAEQLAAYVEAGENANPPFDGMALLMDDVRRVAPMDPASTVPDATGSFPFLAAKRVAPSREFIARAGAAGRRFRERAEKVPFLAAVMDRRERTIGSNEWGVAAAASASGLPMIANDPHLSLNIPSTFYQNHVVVNGDPVLGDMNVNGITFPGVPAVILGQNERITWGATTNPMDVSDLFFDRLVQNHPDCNNPLPFVGSLCIVSGGEFHPVRLALVGYEVNDPGSGIPDDLNDAQGLDLIEQVVLTVPFRSNGPIVDIEDPNALDLDFMPPFEQRETHVLVLQFTGFHATQEVLAFRKWNRAHTLAEFVDGVQSFDFGSQNWAYADADGNLGYFSSAELPLRADLEQGTVDGLPPFFVRDGSGPNNWIPDPTPDPDQAVPFEILPYDEMPQTVNPANGFFANANNDPAGTSLDNDPLNQGRPSKPEAIYYLNPSFSNGLRAGRITQLLRDEIEAGEKIGVDDMKRFQANTQQRDAELMTPFLLAAFANAQAGGAPAELAALAADPGVAEAVGRLETWDFSTPTGIPEGFDAHDTNGHRVAYVFPSEAAKSVAATLYNVWRAKLIKAVVNERLSALGVPGVGSGDGLKAVHHLLTQMPFTGVGASGVDFFPEPAGLTAGERRDVALLAAMREALDALAGPDFAAAFGNSTDQDDYRWGRLHRITFDAELDPARSVPPAGGFDDLAPGLPGIARDGGYEVVNASGFGATADGSNEFRFGGGPVRRYVGIGGAGAFEGARVQGWNIVPGGPSGDATSDLYTSQLARWLTADYYPVAMFESEAARGALGTERFVAPGD